MDETSDQIEKKIQETRNELTDNLSELEEKVKTAIDWRAQFEEHPAAMVGLAFGGGILLSALLPSLRSSRRRSRSRRDASQDHEPRVHSSEPRSGYNENGSQTSEALGSLKGALVGMAATKLSKYIEEWLPGFKQEFDEAKSGKKVERTSPSDTGQPTWRKSSAAGAD